MTATADQVIAVAASQIGYYKTPGTVTKFGQWYGLPTGQWCAMFQSWCADQVGALDIIPKHAYTPSGAGWFQAHGQWHSGSAGMKRGDIVYFDFPGAPVRISHVGIVESGSGPWTTIEGNTSGVSGGSQRNGGLVARKVRSAYIAGYGRPAYAGTPSPVVSTPSPIQIVGSLAVLALQRLLNAHGYSLSEDGIDGPATNGATVDYQSKHGLDPDGVAGPLTLGSLKGVAPAKPAPTPTHAPADTRRRNRDGSLTIAEDGARGPATISRWEEVHGTTIDGVISHPKSACILADQKFLNSVVPARNIRDLTGKNALVEDGDEGGLTIVVRQFWLYNKQARAVLHRSARADDFDHVAGPETNQLHQHALNAATARSGRY